jgi:hypothetical protein
MLLRQATLAESLLRAGLGLLWLNLPLLLGLAAAGRALAGRSRADRLCTLLVAGWVQILLSFELLGSFGLLSLGPLGLLQWLLLGPWLLASRRATRAAASGASGTQPAAPSARGAPEWGALVLLVLLLGLGPWLRQLPRPPALEDTLTYHLSIPAEWLHSGELRAPVQHDADLGPTFYPFAGEALLGWWLLSFGADPFAAGSAWLCLPAALAALLALAEALRIEARAAAAAWALLCTSPLVLWLTLVGFNDLLLGLALLLALKGGVFLSRDPSASRAAETGAALGLCAAVKYSGLALGGGVALAALLALLHAPRRIGVRRALGLCATFLGAAVLSGGYTYARNLFLTGSPVYPAHLEVLGLRLFDGLWSAADWAGHSHNRFDWRRHLGSAAGIARNGWPLVAGLLPLGALAVPLALRRRDGAALLAAASGWIGLLGFWATSPYRHDPRFFVPGLGLLAAGAMLPLAAASRRLGRLFEPLLVLGLGAVYAASGFALGSPVEQALGLAAALAWLALRRRPGPRPLAAALAALLVLAPAAVTPEYLERRYARWEEIYERQRGKVWSALDRLSPSEGLTVAAAGTSNTYPLYGSDLRNRVLFVPRNANAGAYVYGFGHPFGSVFEGAEEAQWLQNLERLEVDLFVLGPARCPERAWIEGRPRLFELVLQAGGYRLYRVRRGSIHG